jgi:hypothetical protein
MIGAVERLAAERRRVAHRRASAAKSARPRRENSSLSG